MWVYREGGYLCWGLFRASLVQSREYEVSHVSMSKRPVSHFPVLSHVACLFLVDRTDSPQLYYGVCRLIFTSKILEKVLDVTSTRDLYNS